MKGNPDYFLEGQIKLYNSSDLILIYKGVINNRIISVLLKYIENTITNYPKLIRKLNRVVIELAQNISFYSEEQFNGGGLKTGFGYIFLKEFEDAYILTTGNKISAQDKLKLLERCNYLNTLNKNGLKNFCSLQRKQTCFVKNRSNIGLAKVAIISTNKLNPAFIEINEKNCIYLLNIKFNKF